MPHLFSFAHLVPLDHGLCVMSTLRADGSIQSTVVNAGVMRYPLTGDQCVGLVAAGGTRKTSTRAQNSSTSWCRTIAMLG